MRTTMSLKEVPLLSWLWVFWANPGSGPFSSQRERNEDAAKSSEYSEFSQAQVSMQGLWLIHTVQVSQVVEVKSLQPQHSQWHQWPGQDHKCKHLLKVSLVPESYEESSRVYVLIKGFYIKVNVCHRFSFIVVILSKTNKIHCTFKALLQCELSGV